MITLTLAKISEAQDAALKASNFTWTHHTQDLVVVFDNYGAQGTSAQLLKVVHGTHVRVRASAGRLE
jgi:hypothetical protein